MFSHLRALERHRSFLEEGGAQLMLKEGVFENPKPDAVFGLHVMGIAGDAGQITYRSGGTLASADLLRITVNGRQTHGAIPWGGVDPIVVASQIVLGIQTIASRQIDITKTPSIITIGSIHGGVRNNIIPDQVLMEGTIFEVDEGVLPLGVRALADLAVDYLSQK